MNEIVTRFAPSPTGKLHLGNVRTALLNWLFARKHGGRFRLRFEDTDRDRSEQAYIESIQDDLRWLGLGWDGEVLFQSGHAGKHAEALATLADAGLAYRCFCSEGQLALDRKLAASRGLPPRYAGRCRVLSAEESGERAGHEPFVWRLAVHGEEGVVTVSDLLRHDVTFALRDLDDPVVVRSDGSFTFLLPNAVDDALDGISHVLRGDDHLTNSAYQVWLLERLGKRPPVYLHHGLLLNEEGGKLSKRSGSHSIAELRAEGLLPEALVQAMVRLGHPNMPDRAHTLEELADAFMAEHISTSSVRWADGEMWRWHARLLHEMTSSELAGLLRPAMGIAPAEELTGFAALIGKNIDRVEEAARFSRLIDSEASVEPGAETVLAEAGSDFFRQAVETWREQVDGSWQIWTAALKERTGKKGKQLFMPLRVALSGALHGPEMSAVVEFLGPEGVAVRLEQTERQIRA